MTTEQTNEQTTGGGVELTARQLQKAELAYSAYARAVGFKTHDGKTMPLFEQLAHRTQVGWYKAYSVSARDANLRVRTAAARFDDELTKDEPDRG